MTYINDQTFNNKHKESEVEITYDIGFNKATKSFPTSTTWAAVFDKCGITTEHLSKIRFRGVGGARINTPVLYETLASCESRRISIDYGGLVGGAPKRLREDDEDEDEDEPNAPRIKCAADDKPERLLHRDDEDEDEDEPNAPRIKCARTTSPSGSSTATNALATSSAAPRAAMLALADATLALSQKLVQPQKNEEDSDSNEDVRLLQTMPVESQEGGFADEFKRVADNIVTLLAAVCSSSAPRLAPLALLLLANRCEAAVSCESLTTAIAGIASLAALASRAAPASSRVGAKHACSSGCAATRARLARSPAMTLANSLVVTLLAAVCSSSAPRLAPLALLLLANRCEAAGTVCHNSKYSSLCDGTFTGTEVHLGIEGLSGTIPPQLGDISQLQKLDLHSNSISGTIPPEMSKLSQLQKLSLCCNSISGTIPPEMSKLSQLQSFLLGGNSISGTIPAETSKLSQLHGLYLHRNSISGTIPSDTGKLSQLEWLYLDNNDISGTVPSQLNDLPLTYCRLGGTNHFACPLPALPNVCTSRSSYIPECNYPPPSPP
eukprot:CAMPEP_0185341492 /NCGR_PEP_ID=MMETSP1363-20130426/98652_1 /TAXON_ID=38817 /ORGANISM="Gephyrocapsa oceanica, Strain RCC1303" /LENGTH=551 /DNA_ID=CAMNT_0027940719 /DNA_START=22 /DNA_END=1673 /DNA_ORIENTATION=+